MKKSKRKISAKSEDIQIKILAVVLCAFLVLILIPLFQISHYNFSVVDDYVFSSRSVPMWQESHSIWKVFYAQAQYTYDMYQTWQGTFFSTWLLSSLLGFFSQDAYFIGTYLSLGGLVICELFSFVVILRKVFHADYGHAMILAISCISMQVLMTTVPVEAYYWFTSAIVYTFIYALSILLVACLVLLYHGRFTRLQLILINILLAILNIATGGSNYITALTTSLIYLFSCTYFFVRHHKFRFIVLGQFALYLLVFILNLAAPGNMLRQNSTGMDHLPAIQSILLSCKEAFKYLMTYTILPYIIVGILLIPIIVNMTKKKSYRYPFPGIVSLLTFGLFAAQFTPTIYALGMTGAGRIQNIYRFSLLIFLYGNEIYWVGWTQRRWEEAYGKKMQIDSGETSVKMCWILPAWIVGGIFLLFSLYFWGGNTVTSFSAWNSLRTGEALQYYAEFKERSQLLEDETKREVVLSPYSVKPYLLFFNDIGEDSSDWVNQTLANWYHKDSVTLQKE